MTAPVLALVLGAALLHASWNAMLRSGTDRRWSMMVMSLIEASACLALVPVLGLPGGAALRFAVLSGVLHVAYNFSLIRTYRHGDLGQTYPIARGSSPVLVTLGAAIFAGEHLNAVSLAGVALVSAGIIALALRGRRVSAASLPWALATGVWIGAYSVSDGLGVRASADQFAYIAWTCMLGSAMTGLLLASRPSVRQVRARPVEVLKAGSSGIASIAAYGAVIWAMHLAPMGAVSALRETSVVFAALLGRLFLSETLTVRRVAACVVIAFGAACLGYAR